MSRMNKLEWFLAKLSFPGQKREILMLISQLTEQGVGVTEALEEIGRVYTQNGRKPREPLALMLREWRAGVAEGRPLSVAMRGWVTKAEELIIAAGEEKNNLVNALSDALDATKANADIRGAILGSLTYPAVLVLVLLAVLYGFSTEMVPTFAAVMDPSLWTGLPATMYTVSGFVESYLFLGLGIIAAFLAAVFLTMSRFRGSARRAVEKLPPYNIYKSIQGASFLLSVSGYVSSGISVENALRRISANATPYMRERTDALIRKMNAGRSLGDAMLDTGHAFPSNKIASLLTVYSEHKNFGANIDRLTKSYIEETVANTRRNMALIQNALLFGVFATVATIAATLFQLQGLIEQAASSGQF
ncbi:type II secretion system F family protein [Tranquillimonas alkanivorans]|uniref:Type II secretory pathway, component PulF n=1 Tax=Tranquillimonas alkanivorans TaxID=441119 RepID=A0A1I5V3I9_9RHOB|nr:type II secretion system F family protein [Tranquillimonas alkanivorans]SFQ01536.1 Type II secretory pathway, component PulF [Tranquillimonas alkanivorans]